MFKFEDYSLKFDGELIVEIANLEFISKGHIMICGEIGSGKSSLAKSLIGYNDFSGKIKFQDVEVEKNKINESISYVPQNLEYYFIMSRIIDEIMFSTGITEAEIDKLLLKYQLLEMKDSSPQVLSGGEKVRLVALLSEIKKAKVLILDETIAMNDYKNLMLITKEIRNIIESGMLVIEITHDFNRLKEADQIIYVKDHQVQNYYNIEDLIKNNQEISTELREIYD